MVWNSDFFPQILKVIQTYIAYYYRISPLVAGTASHYQWQQNIVLFIPHGINKGGEGPLGPPTGSLALCSTEIKQEADKVKTMFPEECK